MTLPRKTPLDRSRPMKRRVPGERVFKPCSASVGSGIPASTSKRSRGLNPVSKARRARSGKPGKLGIVRLYGKDLAKLREDCYWRAAGRCELMLSGCLDNAGWTVGQMAHIKAKRNNGDTLDNVRWSCAPCHAKSHNCNGKPVPPKGSGEGERI